MIESIHSNESNLESIQGSNPDRKRTTYETVRLPKNLRQVGPVDGNKRIYIEDYVMTYIKQLAMKSYGTYQVAVLLGQINKVDQSEYIFISGAVEVKDVIFEDNKVFDNETWTKIYDDIKKYFSELEIVGWYITRPGLDLMLTERIRKIHVDNFAGSNKLLLMYDSVEREEVFYLYTNKNLVKQEGYYIYYEKNEPMQTYMIDHKDKPSIEADYIDKASISIRSVIDRKGKEKVEKHKNNSITYAAASVAGIILLFSVGVYLSGQTNDTPVGNIPVVGDNATTDPSGEDTTIQVKPGDIPSIKDQNVIGDKTNPSASVKPTQTAKPTPTVKPTPSPKPTEDAANTGSDAIPSTHTVLRGETLGSISLKYYHSKEYIKDIMKANGIEDGDRIYSGQTLKLP